jgi:hypothetical protein
MIGIPADIGTLLATLDAGERDAWYARYETFRPYDRRHLCHLIRCCDIEFMRSSSDEMLRMARWDDLHGRTEGLFPDRYYLLAGIGNPEKEHNIALVTDATEDYMSRMYLNIERGLRETFTPIELVNGGSMPHEIALYPTRGRVMHLAFVPGQESESTWRAAQQEPIIVLYRLGDKSKGAEYPVKRACDGPFQPFLRDLLPSPQRPASL